MQPHRIKSSVSDGWTYRGTALLIVAAVSLASLSAACGTDASVETIQSPIMGGTLTQQSDLFPSSTVDANSCSGSIIGPQHVLTAFHCSPGKGSTIKFFSGSAPTGVTRTVTGVYESFNMTADVTTGAPVDTLGDIADWAVVLLDSAIPSGYAPARLADTMLGIGAKVYEVGVGFHDNVVPAFTQMRYVVANIRTDPDACPLPKPPFPLPCRGSILADHEQNAGDSGGPLFTYADDATKTGPLTVHGDLLTADGRYTSTAWHFKKILAATGLTHQQGTLQGGTTTGASFTTANSRACASACRLSSACQGYTFDIASSSCQFLSTPGVALSVTGGVFGVKSATGPCATGDPICFAHPDQTESVVTPIAIGPSGHDLEYFPCAAEGETCTFGGNKYVAYGANGSFVFAAASNGKACTNAAFGSDPAPGVVKSCYFANYTAVASQGGVFSVNGDVAYGANGVFNFMRVNGAVACNDATFGNPTPGPKACYLAVADYFFDVDEYSTMTAGAARPVAFGAQGKFVYGVLTGSAPCTNATFGRDPAPGVVKACYRLPAPFLTDEHQNYSLGGTGAVFYGSGYDGNYLRMNTTGGACTDTAFGGDPRFGAFKHCYGPY